MSDLVGSAGTPCPACGVSVAPGYPRCPKCHALMPGAPASAKVGDAHSLAAGGTSAVSSSNPTPWIIVGVCVVAAVVVAVVVMMRSSKDKSRADDMSANDSAELARKATAGDLVTGDDDDDGELSPARGSGGSPVRDAALKDLGAALTDERLWSDVSTDRLDESKIVVRTQYCEDDRLRSIIDDAKPGLVAAGLTGVLCFEQHGAVVFQQDF